MNEVQVCPWCQTEIVWDEEIGPEDVCPHCDNELTDYRTISLDADEDAEDEDSGELTRYEAAVQQYLDSQEEVLECSQCREYMIEAGEQAVTAASFTPLMPAQAAGPFLRPPFKLRVHLCPNCFHVAYRLSEEDRMKTVQTLQQG